MKFFKECKTVEDAKALFKTLAFEHHPDKGGNTETMQLINSEYKQVCQMLINQNDVKNPSMMITCSMQKS